MLVFVRTGYLNRYVRRNIHLIDDSITRIHYITQRFARDNSRNGHNAFAVFTFDSRRSKALDNFTQLFHTYGFATTVINKNVLDTFNTGTILRCITHFDIVFVSILTILGGNGTIDTVAQIVTGSCQVQSVQSQLLTIEVYLILWLIITTADVYFRYTFHIQQFTFQTCSYTVGFFHTITIYFEVGTCLSRHTRVATTQDHLCFAELRIFLQVLTHLVADLFKADVTISRIDQTDIERNDVGTIVLHRGPGIV